LSGSADRPIHTRALPLPRQVGTVIAICGAVLSLMSFFALPYVSFLSLSVTGAGVAGLSADARQLIYGGAGGEWLLAWWLVPLAAAAALVIAVVEMRTATTQLRKALAAALVGIGATVTVGLLAAFSYLASKINSDVAGAVTGPGFWLTAISMLTIAAGGMLLYNHHPSTTAELLRDRFRVRDQLVEAVSPHVRDEPDKPTGSEHPPTQFGPYRLESLIGQGAMGQVYRAVDTVRGRVVALKLLPVQLAADQAFRARFQAESALAARLREPHIVPIHDYGEIDGRLYIDMRLVEGTDLAQLLAQHGPLSPERAVNMVTQVASALDAAHAAGLAHRDIKPSNILVTNPENESVGEFVYVADFGLARLTTDGAASLTRTGATVGSPDYMAPERFTGGHGDHRVDIYALGCLLFEALTARGPFRAEGLPAIIHAHLNQPPPRPSQDCPDLPPALDAVVARAMAKNPDDRYPSAGALATAARAAAFSPGTPQAVVSEFPTAPQPFSQLETVVPMHQPPWPDSGQHARNPRHVASTIHNPDPLQQPRRHLPRPALVTVAVVALIAAIIGAFIVLIVPGQVVADTEIHREPGGSTGANPFMPPAGNDQPGVPPPPGSGGSFDGNTSGLYGGTLNDSTCDRQAMIKFLQAHPEKGAAWAGVQGMSQAELPAYISGLTPVFLRSDTAVTNHGFANDRATTLNSVLKAGTAVLADQYGVPRARCYCGNPLTPANPPATKRYVGPTWSGFSPASTTTIQAAATPITEFTLVNPFTNEVFYRPVGTAGERDRPRIPPPPPSIPEIPPAPVEIPQPTHAVQPPVQPRKPPAQPVQPAQPKRQQQPCPRGQDRVHGHCEQNYDPPTRHPYRPNPDRHPPTQPPHTQPPDQPTQECNYDNGTSNGCGSAK
jgi:serine/threonine protein kinase